MDDVTEYLEHSDNGSSNWSEDYLSTLDTSEFHFPNSLWHVKPTKEIVLKSTLMVIVGLCGVFLNLIILVILVINKWLWSASNYLVGNLAMTDLVIILFCPWLMLVRDFYQSYILNQLGCALEGFIQSVLLLGSVAAILLVSYDRLAAAALASEARITRTFAPKLIVLSWLTVILISLPWLINRQYVERQWLDYLETYCTDSNPYFMEVYWHFIIVVLVWLPLGILVVTYAGIIWRLETSAKQLASRGGGQCIQKARRKAMRITACVILTWVLCKSPYTVIVYWRNKMDKTINAVDGSYNTLWFIANFMMYLSSAINPLIYGFTNLRFQKAMRKTPVISWFLCAKCCCSCTKVIKKQEPSEEKNTNKVFVIETSPKVNRKLSHLMKNIFHINRESVELSDVKVAYESNKTKCTPLKPDVKSGRLS